MHVEKVTSLMPHLQTNDTEFSSSMSPDISVPTVSQNSLKLSFGIDQILHSTHSASKRTHLRHAKDGSCVAAVKKCVKLRHKNNSSGSCRREEGTPIDHYSKFENSSELCSTVLAARGKPFQSVGFTRESDTFSKASSVSTSSAIFQYGVFARQDDLMRGASGQGDPVALFRQNEAASSMSDALRGARRAPWAEYDPLPWLPTQRDRFGAIRRVGHPYQNRAPPKRKMPRAAFSRHQIVELEKRFHCQKYLASAERSALAKQLKMTDAQVKTWFQNRRTKWRRQTAEERDTERHASQQFFLSLRTDENRTACSPTCLPMALFTSRTETSNK